MLRNFLNKMLHPIVKQYRCEKCSYIFNKPKPECPYCKGRLVEVIGTIENKGA